MGASARLVQIVVGEPAELADGAVVADEASDVPATSGGSADRGEALRERIRQGERGTYIGEILLARDSSLARWPDRRDAPLRVWVADGATIANWDASFPQRVRDAFSTWERVGIPMRFVFAVDSTDADIHVGWVDHFDAPISGKTLWSRDRHWWIVGGNITLALHHNQGEPLDGSAVYAIALHEVGHLLGLDHTADPSNIMTAKVRVRELSDADRATVRLLYSLPPGSVK
jgi:predicted Zn-dependent protease